MSTVTVNNYTTMQQHAEVTDGNVQKVILHASYREGKHMNMQVEVIDAAYVAANAEGVNEAVTVFIRDACNAAAASGLPTAMA